MTKQVDVGVRKQEELDQINALVTEVEIAMGEGTL